MADYKFVELVFEFDPISDTQFKVARSSLTRNPQQLFALLVEKEISKKFLSEVETCGRQLAELFRRFPNHSSTPPEDQWKLKRDGFSAGLLEETLRAFLFLLLSHGFSQHKSQEAMADIVAAVVGLSKPESWGLISEKLGETPSILKILIADSRAKVLCGDVATSFGNAETFQAWARIIAGIKSKCEVHRAAHRAIGDWGRMQKEIRAVHGCRSCRATVIEDEFDDEALPLRGDNFRYFDPNLRTFECLLGNYLGPWKIVLSGKALKALKKSAGGGKL